MSFSRPALTDQELEFLNHGFVDMTYIFVNAVIATLCEPEYLKGSCDQLLIICYHHVSRQKLHLLQIACHAIEPSFFCCMHFATRACRLSVTGS